ncbi:hypothetical protein BO94DRAFT_520494 [Aspergillus sclerotioniger CBS 115572]|uniref:2EXR domain-containing protein n=1 Tax=Aspergillus sclerotioniger CBS 115572 TaxID=1450535 RepID=A0A317W8T6_9EURO|nr:hypothetical protein BO94DRAFT_520494 [Aspergillus sclerotioniger CBS 115572]PWY81717.1 hypothetical protein BO94DRAFT_520494 [Aspergillus sclerotioniger CBS 115572]
MSSYSFSSSVFPKIPTPNHAQPTPAQFPKFPLLPTELRLLIWHFSLPSPVHHGLYIYQKGCWETHLDPENAPGPDPHFNLIFNDSSLSTMRIDIPPFLVNHEAHPIAHHWLQRHRGPIRFQQTPTGFHFMRPFQPNSDALYVPKNRYLEFICEPVDVAWAPGLEYATNETFPPTFPRIAFPKAVLESQKNAIKGIFELYHYENIREVLIVDEMEEEEDDLMVLARVQRPWEWVRARGEELLVWDHQGKRYQRQGGWDWHPEADEFMGLVEKASVNIDAGMSWTGDRFEVRLVHAVRR